MRRVTVTACNILDESQAKNMPAICEQLDLFTDYSVLEEEHRKEDEALARERKRQEAIIELRKQFGKNAVLKGMNFEEGATTKDRNGQIGGHKA